MSVCLRVSQYSDIRAISWPDLDSSEYAVFEGCIFKKSFIIWGLLIWTYEFGEAGMNNQFKIIIWKIYFDSNFGQVGNICIIYSFTKFTGLKFNECGWVFFYQARESSLVPVGFLTSQCLQKLWFSEPLLWWGNRVMLLCIAFLEERESFEKLGRMTDGLSPT